MASGDFIAILELSRKRFSSIFIDKTDIIPKLLLDHNFPVCFVRPRRFGKTFTMTMLSAFCSPSYEFKCLKDSKTQEQYYDLVPKYGQNDYTTHFAGGSIGEVLYQPLKISKDKVSFEKFHANLPVLHISLRKVRGDTQENLIKSFKQCVQQVFQNHRYLAVWEMLNILRQPKYREEREQVYNICSNGQDIETKIEQIYLRLIDKMRQHPSEINLFYKIDLQQCKELNQKELIQCFYRLILLMKDFFRKQCKEVNECQQNCKHQKVLVLVDQFDGCILHLIKQYFEEQGPRINIKNITVGNIRTAAELITRVLSSLSKDIGNTVHNCYMVGITETLLAISQSGVNSTEVYSLGSKVGIVDYRDVFGFTEEQVQKQVIRIMKNKKMPETMFQQIMRIIKSNYKGYGDDNLILYNPWSLVHYLETLTASVNNIIPTADIYWMRTGSSGVLTSHFLDQQTYSRLSSVTLQPPLGANNHPLQFEYRSWGPVHFIDACLSKKTLNENIVFFLLVRFGYLVEIIVNDNLIGFRIPNQEISLQFKEKVHSSWLQNIMGRDMSDEFANQMLTEFRRNFFNLQKFQDILHYYYLKHIKGDKSQISLSTAIYGILHMGLITNHFQSYVQIQYNANGKRIDLFITPKQYCSEQSVVILQCKVNKAKDNVEESNKKHLDDAQWQVYINNYLEACSAIRKQKIWTNVIVRSVVFWQKKNGSWDVEMGQRKIPSNKYKCITDLFTMDKLRQISRKFDAGFDETRLRASFLQKGQIARQYILKFYKQHSLNDLIRYAIQRQKSHTVQPKLQIVQEQWVARAKGTKNIMASRQKEIQMQKSKVFQNTRQNSQIKNANYENERGLQQPQKRQNKSIGTFQQTSERKKQANSPSQSEKKRRTQAELLLEPQQKNTLEGSYQPNDLNHQRYSKKQICRVTENGLQIEKVPPETRLPQKRKVMNKQIHNQRRQDYIMGRRQYEAGKRSLEDQNQGQQIKQNKEQIKQNIEQTEQRLEE